MLGDALRGGRLRARHLPRQSLQHKKPQPGAQQLGRVRPFQGRGAFLAMNSGELGAEVVDEALRNGDVSARSLQRYERTVKHGLKTFSWFIYRITTPALRKMFMSPRPAFHLEQAILSLLAADIL